MKKLFGGKKKKESKTTPFLKVDSDSQANLVVSRKPNLIQPIEQLHLASLMDSSNNISDNEFMHSKSQGTLTTAPLAQSILTKRLQQQPTNSSPVLVMPRPRYAEPPTRAVLKSYENDKIQLDPEHVFQPSYSTLLTEQKGGPALDHSSSPDPIPFKHIRSPQYDDTRSSTGNRKIMDDKLGARKSRHEYRDSTATSEESNQVYESAIASPSVSTLFDNHGSINQSPAPPATHQYGEDDTEAYGITQSTAFDSTTQHQAQESTLQSDQLHSLQQKLKILQKQREIDRMEYGQMEQALVERTKWMNAEMDRTQNKISALKRVPLMPMHQYDASFPLLQDDYDDPPDELYYHQQHPINDSTEYDDPHWTIPQQKQHDRHPHPHHHHHHNATQLNVRKSKSGDSLPCLSRSSSRTSNGGRSSVSGCPIMTRGTMDREQIDRRPYHHPQHDTPPMDRRSGRRMRQIPDIMTALIPKCPRPKSTDIDPQYFYMDRPSSRSSRYPRSRSVERPQPFYHHHPHPHPHHTTTDSYGYPVEDDYSVDEDDEEEEEEEDGGDYLDSNYQYHSPIRRHPARYAYVGAPLPVRQQHRMPDDGYWVPPYGVLPHRYTPTFWRRRRASPSEYIM